MLTRLEFVVRQRLAAPYTGLAGRYGGNPQRTTARPTTERLLKPLQGLTLTIIREGRRQRSHLTPFSRVQRRILALLTFAVDISTRLCLILTNRPKNERTMSVSSNPMHSFILDR